MTQLLSGAPVPFRGARLERLSCGLPVALLPDPGAPGVALQMWARCGAIDEPSRLYGISHGLEHMVFKGTPTRSAWDITRRIEAQGGSMNAATQLETTHYYIDAPATGFEEALEILADTMLNPTFPPDELEREKKVIIEEIHRRDDSPESTLWDEFASAVFAGSPYGIKVIGTEKTVSAMTQDDLHAYFRRHYVPGKLFLSLAGGFDARRTLRQLEKLFATLRPGRGPASPRVRPARRAARWRARKDVQVTYFALGCPSIPMNHPDLPAVDALADVLGGGASARWYQQFREDEQTVLSLSCDGIAFHQAGLFAVFAEARPDRADRAIKGLLRAFEGLEREPVTEDELARVKARIKSDWLHGSETPHGQASTLGSLGVMGDMSLISNYLPRLEALTPDDVMAAWRRHVKGRPMTLARLDPK